MKVMGGAVTEILNLTLTAFKTAILRRRTRSSLSSRLWDTLKESLRTRHIFRMQREIAASRRGFVLSDIITNLERASDHWSNIAVCIIDEAHHTLNVHETLKRTRRDSEEFKRFRPMRQNMPYNLNGKKTQTEKRLRFLCYNKLKAVDVTAGGKRGNGAVGRSGCDLTKFWRGSRPP